MRQEASEAYQSIIASQPQLMSVMGDLLFKYMDFPGAQAVSERIKRTMDPNILDDEQDPQVAAMQMQNQELQKGIELLQGQIAQLAQQLKDKQAEIEIKAMAEQSDAQTDMRKHELELEKLRIDAANKQAELDIKRGELQLKQAEAIQKQDNKDRDDLKEVILQLDAEGNFV